MAAVMSQGYRRYVSALEEGLESLYEVAKRARKLGLDPVPHPEPEVARDLAGLVEGFIGPSGVGERIRELSKRLSREEAAFKIAEEIVHGKFGHMEEREAAEQAVRTALAILTEGVTAAVYSEGIAQVTIKSNSDRTRYLAVYLAGPIRSAGGTETALTPVVGDFVRRLLGLDRYKPTDDEIGRFIEELRLYEREVGRFQYSISDEALRYAVQCLPVEVTGTQSDLVEVSSYRNLPRIETNRVRGGALRLVNDGIIGRSAKVRAVVEKLGIEGWGWLKEIEKIKEGHKESGVMNEEEGAARFMEGDTAGRPFICFPSRRGGFRLRYGRARNTGLAAVGLHPATMRVLQDFIAGGTHLLTELPGKGGIVLPVDAIEPPIVRLGDGSVVRVSLQNIEQIGNDIDKILFVGDILIGFGDFLENNRDLLPSGFTEEWWCEELRKRIQQSFGNDLKKAADATGISVERLQALLDHPLTNRPTAEEALTLSSAIHVPLHPSFTFFWSDISAEEFVELRRWALDSKLEIKDKLVSGITGAMREPVKGCLERIWVPHRVTEEGIRVEGDEARVLAFCLGTHAPSGRVSHTKPVLEVIRDLTGLEIREKAPATVGARMGRPEKAKRREMKPMVHALFPVGLAGGPQRDLVKASSRAAVEVEISRRLCPRCRASTFLVRCPRCGSETVLQALCPRCGRTLEGAICPVCRVSARSYEKQPVNLKEMMDEARRKLGYNPSLVKGVKGLINETKTAEVLEKGILRAKHALSVYKDGTVRFDATNAPLTHFKPGEIGAPVERLRQLGYRYDVDGDPLSTPDQMCELKVQDVILPRRCADYFLRVAGFLDELLEKVYGLDPYYRVTGPEDLIGHLVIGLAPHTSVGVVGRILGFTSLNVCYAHPLWHSAKRRDCDGDEDAVMLALDPLLNFSRAYLPAQIGGIMDTPLFVISVVNPVEVQRQAHNVDVAAAYPRTFYESTWGRASPREVSALIDLVGHRLGTEAQFEGFHYTVPVSDINMGNRESAYKRLGKMEDKLKGQLALAEKIEAVDVKTVAWKVLTTHLMPDIAGNLRAYSTQAFRCKTCSRRFRRLPLRGRCPACGGEVSLTVYRGGIEKYLEAANRLVKEYGLPEYYAQRLTLVQGEIDSLFGGGKSKQVSLTDFVA